MNTLKKKNIKWKEVYMIGIKGVGMTMLAQLLASQGVTVSGSDVKEKFMTDQVLKRAGIKIKEGFSAGNVPASADAVIYSAAYLPETNEELGLVLSDKKIKAYNYAEALGMVFSSHRKGIAVCGSHGKTTVSAWLGYVLEKSGVSPSILVGARVPQLGGSAVLGKSEVIVAEADEYQDKLRFLDPFGIVMTNIDYDHPDYYHTRKDYFQAFFRFVSRLPQSGWLAFSGDDAQSVMAASFCLAKKTACFLQLEENLSGHFFADSLIAHSYRRRGAKQEFLVNDLGKFSISLLGQHNVRNALLVIAAARNLGVSMADIKQHLAGFKGAARRSQLLGRYNGALIYDDYGHHPTEIKATIKAFRDYFPEKNLVVLFHPHTFTRTKALFKDFISSFDDCDSLAILEIYGSAREKAGGVSSRDLIDAIKERNRKIGKKQPIKYLPDLKSAVKYFSASLERGDVLLLLGAGDVFRVGEEMLGKKK